MNWASQLGRRTGRLGSRPAGAAESNANDQAHGRPSGMSGVFRTFDLADVTDTAIHPGLPRHFACLAGAREQAPFTVAVLWSGWIAASIGRGPLQVSR